MTLDYAEKMDLGFRKGNSLICVTLVLLISFGILIAVYFCSPTNGCSCVVSVPKYFKKDVVMKWLKKWRGYNYFYMDLNHPNYKEISDLKDVCPVTIWSICHIVMYAIIGFIAPKLFWPMWIFGVIFEMIEYLAGPSQCPLDLGWNFLGLLIGISIRYTYDGVTV
jgi:hypothetical protein